jgi:hypothetical protein
MGIGNFFKSIFESSSGSAKSDSATSEPLEYNGFSIEAAPIDEGGKYRTAGYISGEVEGEIKRVYFIRADENSDRQSAIDHSISKARQIIDEQGSRLLLKTRL